MHLTLLEGNGIAGLASKDLPLSTVFSNATATLTSPGRLIDVGGEATWIDDAAAASIRPINRAVVGLTAVEEAEVLQHPDVLGAVAAALPEIEAWERTL